MFGRLRLVRRDASRGSAMAKHAAKGQAARGAVGGVDVKALVSKALAQPPTWTNSLPVADPKGRAANTAAVFPVPWMAASDTAKGDATWPTSAAPR
jgi:hypothetical protein